MFDDDLNQRKGDDRGPKKPAGGFNIPTFTWVAWIAIIGCIVAWMLLHSRLTPQAGPLSESDFLQKFEANQIASAMINDNLQSSRFVQITGNYYKTEQGRQPGQAAGGSPVRRRKRDAHAGHRKGVGAFGQGRR